MNHKYGYLECHRLFPARTLPDLLLRIHPKPDYRYRPLHIAGTVLQMVVVKAQARPVGNDMAQMDLDREQQIGLSVFDKSKGKGY